MLKGFVAGYVKTLRDGKPAPPRGPVAQSLDQGTHNLAFRLDAVPTLDSHLPASLSSLTGTAFNDENRSQRAPPQPFRGQAHEKFVRASSQVFCESYPRNRPAGLVLSVDQTPSHALRISAMEDRPGRKPPRQIRALNVILRLPLRSHQQCGVGASATSPAHNPGRVPNLFGSLYCRAPAQYPDFVRFARLRARSCVLQSFLRAAAIRDCKECRCKQRRRTILNTLAPIVSQKLWHIHTGW